MNFRLLLTISLISFCTSICLAQNNACFPVENFYLNESHSSRSIPNPFLFDYEEGSIFTKNSFVRNSTTYYHLYYNYNYLNNTGSSGQTSTGFNQRYLGELNYDTLLNKVYLNNALLYDFGLMVGDIYPVTYQNENLDSNIRVVNIDTIVDPYNITRKIFYIKYINSTITCGFNSTMNCGVIVEGIGNINGLLGPLFDCFEDCSNQLSCGRINNNNYLFNNGINIGACTMLNNKNISSSFPDNNYFYNEKKFHRLFDLVPFDEFYYTVYNKKDTIINNTTHQVLYMKYKTKFYSGPPPNIQGDIPIAILRNDKVNKKVFIKKYGFKYWNFNIPKDSTEKLLFDFTLKVGDFYSPNASYSVNIPDSLFVTKIDTIIDADNIKRAVYIIDTKDSILLEKGVVVEGIGGRNGLFGNIFGVMDWSYQEDFVCYANNSFNYTLSCTNTYADINYLNFRCDTLLFSSVQNTKQHKINIYPNPTSNFIYIDDINPDATFTIQNIYGQVVSITSEYINDKWIIDVNKLTKGIYFIHTFSNNITYYGKIIKQ